MMPLQQCDQIRVLLIDDAPGSGLIEVDPGERAPNGDPIEFPSLGSAGVPDPDDAEVIKTCFRLRWIATATEAREFRDLTTSIALRDPSRLGVNGWVPEVVCFDYALSKRPIPVLLRGYSDARGLELSPLPPLRECAKALGLHGPDPNDKLTLSDTGDKVQEDNYGCYSGALIVSALSGHPCGPVPHTVKNANTIRGREVFFFEWMLRQEFGQAFDEKVNLAANWHRLLAAGVGRLRASIIRLARESIVRVGWESLAELAAATDTREMSVEIADRFGKRHLPVDGLFIDFPRLDRARAAREWTLQALGAILGDLEGAAFASTKAEIQRGISLATELWHAYGDDQLVEQRRLLSDLSASEAQVSRQSVAARETGETIGSGRSAGHLQLNTLRGSGPMGFDVAEGQCTARHADLRSLDGNAATKRWAALFIVVLLLKQAHDAVDGLKAAGLSVWNSWLVSEDDFYLGLFPAAQSPLVLPFHKPDSTWYDWLRNTLRIVPSDLLEGKSWSTDAGPNAKGKKSLTGGLHPHERRVMASFALSKGFGPELWGTPKDQPHQILSGDQ